MVDLSSVRLHASTAAERKAQSLSARAFTFGNDIFLGHGEHPTDLTLISHEAAHVIQQQHTAPVMQAWSSDRSDRYEREADQAASAVASGQSFSVRERVDSPRVQRFGISDALDWLADKAYIIPGFRMFTIVLGVNPVNMQHVERSAANVLRAIVEFLPGGTLITDALEKYGIFDKVGNWISGKIDELGMVGSSIKKALMDFLDSLSWRDIFHLGDVWDRAKKIFTDPIDKIISFVKGTIEDIWKFVRDAVLKPIAKLAEGTSGWPLLIAVMGKNPITGEAVPRTPETLIGGFMHLIHEDEIWENLKKANAVARAFAWFQSVLSGLLGFVSQIPDLFIKALKSLEWSDILDLPGGFMKIVGVFGKFLGNFISWAGGKVWDLLQIIFEVVAPKVMPYLLKVGAAFKKILKDPLGFVRHLIDAALLGLNNFLKNFGDHLKKALLDWLVGALPGIYIPKAFTLSEFGMFVLSILGITWAQIRAKIVKALGPNGETIMKGLETAFDIVVALIKGGPAAAWDLIKEKLTNLKDMVVDGIVGLVTDTIIKKAIPKLIAMFIPGAGFISAIISIYGAIMTFVEKLSKIVAAVKAFVDSIVAIANGQIAAAAGRVESGLETMLSLTISFLANFFGLGGVANKVMEFIKKLQGLVDKGLDTAIAWIVDKAKKLWGSAKGAVAKVVNWLKMKVTVKGEDETHVLSFAGEATSTEVMIASTVMPLETFLDAQENGASKERKNAIASIRKQLKEVKKDIASYKPDKEDEALQKKIEAGMNKLGDLIVPMLTGGDWGSKSNPAPLDYEKRRSASYPVFYLATGKAKQYKQETMKDRFPGDAQNGKIFRYLPNSKQDSPGDEEKLGLDTSRQVEVGLVTEFEDKGTRGGKVPSFRGLVSKYGLVPSEEGWDIDHVIELQIGGRDEFGNLWPLPAGENRSSGSIIKNAETKDDKGKTISVADAFKKMKKKGKSLWLIIVSTHQR